MRPSFLLGAALAACAAVAALPTSAATPQDLLAGLRAEAGNAAFSAERGRALYTQRTTDWSCASCHTTDPRGEGRHAVTGKTISPFAPAANAERFTNPAKVEKWFRRNCNDVLGRQCTTVERGDLLTYVLSLSARTAP